MHSSLGCVKRLCLHRGCAGLLALVFWLPPPPSLCCSSRFAACRLPRLLPRPQLEASPRDGQRRAIYDVAPRLHDELLHQIKRMTPP